MSVTVDAHALRLALRTVRHATDKSYTKPILSTILLTADDGHLYAVAADNFRISQFEIPVLSGDPSELGRLTTFIDEESLALIWAAVPKVSGVQAVDLGVDGDLLTVAVVGGPSVTVEIHRSWGKWPDYLKVREAAPQPVAPVALSPFFVQEAGRAARRSPDGGSVFIAIGEPEKPVRFECGPLTEWIMPIRVVPS